MTQQASVVTPERYATGKTFQQYVDSGIRNKELFERNYNDLTISEDRVAKLKALAAKPNGVHHMMVVGEDWCPDVYRGAGVGARIAEAAGIEYRYFERDQNKDIIAEHLNNGEFESIPVYVFYDKDHNELGEFIERPALATEQLPLTREALGDTSPEGIAKRLGHEPSEEEIAAARAESREKYLEWQKGEIWANWRVAAVDEVIDLLEKATA